jgi:hypothetical protein
MKNLHNDTMRRRQMQARVKSILLYVVGSFFYCAYGARRVMSPRSPFLLRSK